MNKLLIPSILTAIVLVAGMFAVMPIQQASTVHTTIIAAIKSVGGSGSMVSIPIDLPAGSATPQTITILKGQTGITYKIQVLNIIIHETGALGTIQVISTPSTAIPGTIATNTLSTAGTTGLVTGGGSPLAFPVTLASGDGLNIVVIVPVAGSAAGLAGTVTLQVTQA